MTSLRWLKNILLATIVLGAAMGCGGGAGGGGVTVFAAASLSEAFGAVARAFELRNPGAAVKLNFAGSQRLRAQLEFGAGAEVFASADLAQMDLAREAGLVAGGVRVFAAAPMAVIVNAESGIDGIGGLAAPGVKLALAHESVPAGQYARRLLERLSEEDDGLAADAGSGPDGGLGADTESGADGGLAADAESGADAGLGADFAARALANVVSEETSVKFVEQKVVLGQADAGIVYRPGAITAAADGRARALALPSAAEGVRALYPIAALKDAANPEMALRFIDFVLSDTAQEILAGYGFDAP